jgi:hypothetical protein
MVMGRLVPLRSGVRMGRREVAAQEKNGRKNAYRPLRPGKSVKRVSARFSVSADQTPTESQHLPLSSPPEEAREEAATAASLGLFASGHLVHDRLEVLHKLDLTIAIVVHRFEHGLHLVGRQHVA